jgi:hypothetical protein
MLHKKSAELQSIRKMSLRDVIIAERGRHDRLPYGCRREERTPNLDDLDIYAEDADLTEE